MRLVSPGNPDQKAGWLTPFAATASQHYYGQTLRWLAEDGSPADQAHLQTHVEHTSNERPKIFIAQGSHATFFSEDPEICIPCFFLPSPRLGNTKVYDADCTCVGYSAFDNTAPASLDGISFQLIGLSEEVWLTEFGGRFGYLEYDDPEGTGNGPPGPLHRSAHAPDGSPVSLLNEPCRLHNLAILRTVDQEVLIDDCPTQ